MKPLAITLLATSLLCSVPLVTADTLLIEAIEHEPVNSPEGLLRPRSGMSMDQTRAKFGNPKQEIPWVGEPPISRWVYDNFTVYFEHEHVITTVVHR